MKKRDVILTNAFSIQMIEGKQNRVSFIEISLPEVLCILNDKHTEFKSAIGHADTAKVLSSLLDRDIEVNRININLNQSVTLIVAQLVGGRLPEGCTTLPEGFEFKFYIVESVDIFTVDYTQNGKLITDLFEGTYTEAKNYLMIKYMDDVDDNIHWKSKE